MIRHEFRMAFHRKEVYVMITLGIIISLLGVATTRNLGTMRLPTSYSAFQTAMIYGANTLQVLYVLLVPIIASLSYTDSYVFEKKSGLDGYLLTRQKHKSGYFVSKGVVIFLLSFSLVAFPLLLNQVLCLIAFPAQSYVNFQLNTPYDSFFYRELDQIVYPGLALNQPLFFNIMHIALYGFYGSSLAMGTYAITLFLPKNRAAVIALPILVALTMEMMGSLITTDITPSNSMVVYSLVQRTSMLPMPMVILGIHVISLVFVIVRGAKVTDELAAK